MIIVTLTLTALLCLAFASTRVIGVIGLAILFCIYPLFFTAILFIAAVALYFFTHYQKEIKNVFANVLRKIFTGSN